MLVFAAMFHVYRYGRARAKAPPPRPVPPTPTKPATVPAPAKPAPATTAGETQKPMASPPTVTTRVGSEQMAQLAQQQQQQQQQKYTASGTAESSGKTEQIQDHVQVTSTAPGDGHDKKTL
jgi:hypothetical protein